MDIDVQDAFDINFFESVIKRNPKDVDALELLGGLYSKYGMAKQSLNLSGCGKPASGRGKICNEGADTIKRSQHGAYVYLN